MAEPTTRTFQRWRENPCAFVRENFGVTPQAWQEEALRAFGDPTKSRISLQACAGPGKTAVLAWCAWNFMSCYCERAGADGYDHPKGAATSITEGNLNDHLWPELAKWQARSPYLSRKFTWTASRVYENANQNTWFMSAKTWPKTASPDEQGKTLSGLHARFVLALIDESGAIPPTVLRAAEQALADKPRFGKILQAGNPISLDGMLYAATRHRDQWHIVRVTGDPDDPKRSPRIDLEWAKQQIAAYGRDNPWVMSYILGQFPPASMNALLGVDAVEQAMRRHYRPHEFDFAQKRIGIDAARFGDDPWVLCPRQGLRMGKPVEMRHPRTEDVVARLIMAKQAWGSDQRDREYFDGSGGYAAGAIDAFRLAGYSPAEVHAEGKPTDPRFVNKRSEMAFALAEWVKRGGALYPLGEWFVDECTAITYFYTNGKFQIEPKALIKKKLGRSPNYFDALALTFAEADMPREMALVNQQAGKALSEWNPYEERT